MGNIPNAIICVGAFIVPLPFCAHYMLLVLFTCKLHSPTCKLNDKLDSEAAKLLKIVNV